MVAQVTDYSKHGDINKFIEKNHRDPLLFKSYRENWTIKNNDKPLFVLFETTSKCNLRCNMCVQSVGYEQTERMQDGLFDKAVSEIKKLKIPAVAMNQINEPLLDKKIFEKIEKVSSIDTVVDIHMNTNAVLLNKKNSEKLLNSKLTRLLIGFDGFSKEVFEKVRERANYQQVFENIINFLDMKKQMKKTFPVTRISFVKTSENEHEIPKWFEFWRDKADYITVQEFISPVADLSKSHLIPNTSERVKIDPDKIICTQPSERITIRGDGNIIPCCSHIANKMPMGNLNESSIHNIWNNEKFKKLRKNLLTPGGYKKNKICKSCIETTYNLKTDINN
tara:strand:+ start:256 stop:1263 length:1008 start_codon:yes stop_codon:yes gene_type:complete